MEVTELSAKGQGEDESVTTQMNHLWNDTPVLSLW